MGLSTSGVVAAGDPHCAEAGVEMLRRGGNAVDAAVAATFTAWTAEPVLSAPFGGGFALVTGGASPPAAYDFFASIPGRGLAAASAQEGLDFHGVEVSFGPATQVFHVGRGAVAASRLLPGLIDLHRDHGALPLATVVEPAVTDAERGVPLSAGIVPILDILEPILFLAPDTAALFAPTGRLLRTGERFANPDLARLLSEVGAGRTHELPQPSLLARFGPPAGRLTEADLHDLGALRASPLEVEVCGHTFVLTPPPASGGLLVAFGLKLLETVPASRWQDDVATACHLLACMAVTVAARRAVLDGATDPKRAANELLSDLDAWREPFERIIREGPAAMGPAEPHPGNTTHVSVLDESGLACAITSSNGEGCGYLVPGTGAMANNFLGEEDLHPRGFHRQPAGTRLSSMMCPTAVVRDGRTVLTLGTGGSNRIRTAILQVLVRHILRGESIEHAVQAPRLHYEGDRLYVEARGPGSATPAAVMDALRERVDDTVVFDVPNIYFGGVHAAAADGGAGDLRRGGSVRVV